MLLLAAKRTSDSQHISFQDFLTRYLVHQAVGKLVSERRIILLVFLFLICLCQVVLNGESVAVYPKSSDPNSRPVATFRIGSVDHFEKVLRSFLSFVVCL